LSRRRRGLPVHGVVLLDKPAGISSNQALQQVKRLFDAQKAGHTGNLDPFATGMLPICLGEATKTAAFMLDADKAYRAVARLGEATRTGDVEGEVVHTLPVPVLDERGIRAALADFTGAIEQVPPMYSALKYRGKPLYQWAREGVQIERQPRTVVIHAMALLDWTPPQLEFEVCCSKGTYIRTLAEDLAARLGTCAHLVALRRLWVGPFQWQAMVNLEMLAASATAGTIERHLLPVDAGLASWPIVRLDAAEARSFGHGNPVSSPGTVAGGVRVQGPAGNLLGLAQCGAGGRLEPRRLFRMPVTGLRSDSGSK